MEEIKLSGREAINVDNIDIQGTKVGKVQLSPGTYTVSLASTLNLRVYDKKSDNKIVLFSALPLKTCNPGEWYIVLNTKKSTQIEIKQNHTSVYAVLLDQDPTQDGIATITFTKAT